MTKRTERLLAFGFGIFGLGLLYVTALYIVEPTPFQYLVFRILLSLAAAGFAINLSGFLEVNLGDKVRATGAFAIFVATFFFSPAALPQPIYEKEPDAATLSAAEKAYIHGLLFDRNRRSPKSPLDGLKIAVPSAQDTMSRQNLRTIFDRQTVKVVIPFYVGGLCPASLVKAAVIADTISKYLAQPTDLVILNLFDNPSKVQLDSFGAEWDLPKPWYFISGNDEQKQDVAKAFLVSYQKTRLDDGTYLYNHTTNGYIFVPGREEPYQIFFPENNLLFDATAERKSVRSIAESILVYIIDHQPQLLKRGLISGGIISKSNFLIPSAYANETQMLVGSAVDQAISLRLAKLSKNNIGIDCEKPKS